MVLIPFTESVNVTLRFRDGTKYVFFWMFGSNRRFVRRCECEMLCPKPGVAPVTWQTAAMFPPVIATVGLLSYPRSLVGTQSETYFRRKRPLCAQDTALGG